MAEFKEVIKQWVRLGEDDCTNARPDVERAIKALTIESECVARDCDRNCGECELAVDRQWLLDAYNDALELLQRTAPRVMTPEEVRDLKTWDVVWIEEIDDPDEDVHITEYINRIHVDKDRSETGEPYCEMLFKHFRETLGDYASYWRCWTARPSHEQLRETPWGMKSWTA